MDSKRLWAHRGSGRRRSGVIPLRAPHEAKADPGGVPRGDGLDAGKQLTPQMVCLRRPVKGVDGGPSVVLLVPYGLVVTERDGGAYRLSTQLIRR